MAGSLKLCVVRSFLASISSMTDERAIIKPKLEPRGTQTLTMTGVILKLYE